MGQLTTRMETARAAARKRLAANPDFTIRRYLAIPAFQDMPDYPIAWCKGDAMPGCPKAEKLDPNLWGAPRPMKMRPIASQWYDDVGNISPRDSKVVDFLV